jgi:hypothetical protein
MEPRLVDGKPVDPDEFLLFRTNSTSVTIDEHSGLISYTPSNEDALRKTVVVRVTVIDQSSETSVIDITFVCENVNDPPELLTILGIIDGQTIKQFTSIAMRGSALDVDTQLEELYYRWYVGSTLIGQTSDIEWRPEVPGPTFIRMVVTDEHDAESQLVIQVLVEQINQPPYDLEILGLDDGQTVRSDGKYTVQASAKDDIDHINDMTYEWFLDGMPLNQLRSFNWIPLGEGPVQMTLKVTDSGGESIDSSILVIIEPVPELPEIVEPPPGSSIEEDEKVEFSLEFPNSTLDPDKDYTITISSNVSGHLITLDAEEDMSFDVGKLPPGDHRITITVSDGTYETSTTMDMTIEEVEKKTDSPCLSATVVLVAIIVMVIARMSRRSKD